MALAHGGMVHHALEVVFTLDPRDVRFRRKPNSGDEPPRPRPAPILTFDCPLVRSVVKPRRLDGLVVLCMIGEMDLGVDMVKVPTELVPVRVPLAERKVLPELFVKELVQRRVRVDPCACTGVSASSPISCTLDQLPAPARPTWVVVGDPNAAAPPFPLKDPALQAQLLQPRERRHGPETCRSATARPFGGLTSTNKDDIVLWDTVAHPILFPPFRQLKVIGWGSK